MLRSKLFVRIGLLVLGFVAGAVIAIVLLQSSLREIDRVDAEAPRLVGCVIEVGSAITAVEAARLGGISSPDDAQTLADELSRMDQAVARLGEHAFTRPPDGPGADTYGRLQALAALFAEVARSAPHDAQGAAGLAPLSVSLRREVLDLERLAGDHVAHERAGFGQRFRALVIGLTLAALVMVNVAIIVLLRTARLVLRPVGALVEASRELAREHFGHRVRIDQDDEFGELALAYNRLAQELEAREERKMETLRQVAIALNHDLNNAISIIELQLRRLDRQTGGNPTLRGHLRDIHESLDRMTRTVASLKNVRRIVLTEYLPGEPMLDLERSTVGDDNGPRSTTTGAPIP